MAQPESTHPLVESRRDPEAFTRFYRERYEAIVAYFARRVYDPEVALDLTAETFAQAYISRKRFRGRTAPEAEAWLYRIAQSKLSHYHRRGRLERRALSRLQIELPAISAAQAAEVRDLGDLVGLRTLVEAGMGQLSAEQRDALRLRIVEDLPYADVARRLRISEPAARARVSRALTALTNALQDQPSTA